MQFIIWIKYLSYLYLQFMPPDWNNPREQACVGHVFLVWPLFPLMCLATYEKFEICYMLQI